ncbi:hypothetical protein CL673_04540 [Candidatus Bathyarchaeota archaeon]|nr:hypothetical protein [Candidatus Bathyarchaeota archaeon]
MKGFMIELNAASLLDEGVAEFSWDECHQCGKCTSGCPSAKYLDLNPRRIVAMTQRDLIREVLDSGVIWTCTGCLQCIERCPRDITPYDIIVSLQNQAVREGLPYPKGLSKMIGSVKRHSSIQLPQEVVDREFDSFERDELGLPEMSKPMDMKKFLEALEKVMEERDDA